jgi:RNA polymerase sigma-70 factor (ECF subfamily)
MNLSAVDMTTDCPGYAWQESELVAGLRMGDAAAFETLVRRHGGQMLAVARRLLRCEQDADDAWQEALLCVFRKADTFEENARLSTWLHRITVNACLMKLRSQRRRREVEMDDLLPTFHQSGHHTGRVSDWESPAENTAMAEVRLQVRECIDRLPESYRMVLLLRDIEEKDSEEVAKMLGCSANCVKTRLHRARQALRTLLEPVILIFTA